MAVVVPLAEWIYIRKFPVFAPLMGYGSVADELASAPAPAAAPLRVSLYTAAGCPFCPLLKERLVGLRQQAGFELEVIDITLRPQLLAAKGINSVPAVETGGKILTGLLTTKQLAEIVDSAAAAERPKA